MNSKKNSKNILLLFLRTLLFLSLKLNSVFLYELSSSSQKSFSSSRKKSVTYSGYPFLDVLRQNVHHCVILSLRFSYSLQSQNICSSVCNPSPHSHSALGTRLNLLKWLALIRFIDTKARRSNYISRNHGEEPCIQYLSKQLSHLPHLCFDGNCEAPLWLSFSSGH